MAAIDYFADICADGTEVQSSRGAGTPGVDFGGTFAVLPEDGMFVRACSAHGHQYAIVKGHQTDHAHIIDETGTTLDLGITHGNYCVTIQPTAGGVRAVWIANLGQYGTAVFTDALVQIGTTTFSNIPTESYGTSQGILDLLEDGEPIYTDRRFFQTIKGVNLIRSVFRAGWWIGQSDGFQYPDGIYGVQYKTGTVLTLHDQLAFEPHATLSDSGTAVLWAVRQLDGTALYGSITQQVESSLTDTQTAGQRGLAQLAAIYYEPVVNTKSGIITKPWYDLFIRMNQDLSLPVNLGDVTGILDTDHGGVNPTPSGDEVPAPRDAEYIVAAADGTLTDERVATDTDTITWDFTVAGQAKANVADAIIEATFLTAEDETAALVNSSQLLAGTNVTFDDTVAGERTVNAGSWIPLVDGSEPPVLVSDGAGHLILVAGP